MGVYQWGRLVLISLALATQPVSAELRHYSHRTADGVMVFSDTPLKGGVLTRTSYGTNTRLALPANPCRGLSSNELDRRGRNLDADFARVAETYALDAMLLKAIARAESCFDPGAVSRVGAQGLMQLMPATARELGISNPHDALQSLQGGAEYLAEMLERYSHNTRLALAAYNAGPGNVDRYQGIPPFPETRNYVKTVLGFQQQYTEHAAAQ